MANIRVITKFVMEKGNVGVSFEGGGTHSGGAHGPCPFPQPRNLRTNIYQTTMFIYGYFSLCHIFQTFQSD